MLIRHQVRKIIGQGLIVRINPRSVHFHVGTNQPYTINFKKKLQGIEAYIPRARLITKPAQKVLYSVEPYLLSDFVFDRTILIERELRYRLIEDLVKKRRTVQDSLWFSHLFEELNLIGSARYKSMKFNSVEEIISFLDTYALGLVRSLEADGYDETASVDIGTAFVDHNGRIVKSDAGNHRFAAAHILGIPTIPVEVLGVHRRFYKSSIGHQSIKGLADLLCAVEAEHQL